MTSIGLIGQLCRNAKMSNLNFCGTDVKGNFNKFLFWTDRCHHLMYALVGGPSCAVHTTDLKFLLFNLWDSLCNWTHGVWKLLHHGIACSVAATGERGKGLGLVQRICPNVCYGWWRQIRCGSVIGPASAAGSGGETSAVERHGHQFGRVARSGRCQGRPIGTNITGCLQGAISA